MKKRTVLILIGRYLPGHKDGGPIRTIANLVDNLGDEYDLKIVTNDRDRNDAVPYHNINVNNWNQVGKANVFYVPPSGFTFSLIKKLSHEADSIYCCGFYDDYAYKTMILKKLRLIKKPVVIASMGSFSEGAIQIKSLKKRVYIRAGKVFGLFSNLSWSVTSELEKKDLQNIMNKKAKCFIAENLPRKICDEPRIRDKQTGELKIVFLSRIARMKNLAYAIQIISQLEGNVSFSIFGYKEDLDYWDECLELLKQLPENVTWKYEGVADPEHVVNIFQDHDLFLLPTLGENFGHVIFEALAAGCVPVISDTTPWLDFEHKYCGDVINLNDFDKFVNRVQEYVHMDNMCFRKISQNALLYALEKGKNRNASLNGYRAELDHQ